MTSDHQTRGYPRPVGCDIEQTLDPSPTEPTRPAEPTALVDAVPVSSEAIFEGDSHLRRSTDRGPKRLACGDSPLSAAHAVRDRLA
jgi:hypothetical protein